MFARPVKGEISWPKASCRWRAPVERHKATTGPVQHVSQARLGACRNIEVNPGFASRSVGLRMNGPSVRDVGKHVPAQLRIPVFANGAELHGSWLGVAFHPIGLNV